MPKLPEEQKPVLKPIDNDKGLFVIENLERNPPEKRDVLHKILSAVEKMKVQVPSEPKTER